MIATTPLLRTKEIPTLQYDNVITRLDASWENTLSTLLGLGRAAGADLVEFFLERVNFVSCLAEDDTITSISPRLTTGAGVRVFKGKADCYVSTNNVRLRV
jgi:TldD protein